MDLTLGLRTLAVNATSGWYAPAYTEPMDSILLLATDHTSATHTYRAHSSVYSSPGAEMTIAGARGYRRRMDLIASTATPGSPRTACT